MLITRYFVYLHNMKTGGIWFRNVVVRAAPKSWQVRDLRGAGQQHTPLRGVASMYPAKPIISVVRNPWDWWVSWFFFNKKHTQVAKSPSSKAWAKKYSDCPSTRDGFVRALPRLLEGGSKQWPFLTDGARRVDHLVRYEELRKGIVEALKATGAPISRHLMAQLMERPPDNVSMRKPYRSYYDDAMSRMVADAEADLIEELGYTF